MEMNTKLKSVLLVAGLSLSAQAAIIYQDDFSGTAGSLLNGRAPNVVNTTGNTYTAASVLELNGSGRAVSSNGGGYASIALPAVTEDDVVVMEAVFRPRSSNDNWMAFGLAKESAADLTNHGTAWVNLRGGPHANGGRVTVFSGNATSGQLYQTATPPEAGWAGATDPSTMKITYTVKTGNMKVELGANTVFEGLIDYNGVADTPAPLSAIDHFTLQWSGQDLSTSATPGYFDSVTVSVIPEPATIGMLGLGTLVTLGIRRKLMA